ncbi:MAG: DinB family protein [Acidobacteria bacterium]|nr:DinB family protein [Acidobacteriota bacterium]
MRFDSALVEAHFRFSQWAAAKLLKACRALSTEELSRDLGSSFGGVLGTLEHILHADRIWLARVSGYPAARIGHTGEFSSLDGLAQEWRRVNEGWMEWARARTAADLESILSYTNTKGELGRMPVYLIVLHVVNHASYHRGQVVTMLRQLGKPAPQTDLSIYWNSKMAAGA